MNNETTEDTIKSSKSAKTNSIQDLIIKTEKVAWRDLTPFQPSTLKTTTEARMDKLKKSLINNGFAMSFYVFEKGKKIYIIDGHHRHKALDGLESDGVDVPTHFTCSFLNVKNNQHAKKLVLAFNSHYAEIEKEGLFDFIGDLNFDEVKEEFDLPSNIFEGFDNLSDEPVDDAEKQIESKKVLEVLCSTESELEDTYNKLTEAGYECRILKL